MKKTYEKPGLYVENFALSQSIAAGCGTGANHTTSGTPTYSSPASCGWDTGWGIIWTSSNGKCNDHAQSDAIIEDFGCYNGPNNGFQMFAS